MDRPDSIACMAAVLLSLLCRFSAMHGAPHGDGLACFLHGHMASGMDWLPHVMGAELRWFALACTQMEAWTGHACDCTITCEPAVRTSCRGVSRRLQHDAWHQPSSQCKSCHRRWSASLASLVGLGADRPAWRAWGLIGQQGRVGADRWGSELMHLSGRVTRLMRGGDA